MSAAIVVQLGPHTFAVAVKPARGRPGVYVVVGGQRFRESLAAGHEADRIIIAIRGGQDPVLAALGVER